MLARGDPRVAVALHGLILASEVMTLAVLVGGFLSPLAQGACTSAQLALDDRVRLDPVGQCVFAVLDDRLGGLIAVVCVAGLAGGDRIVVDELEEMLSVAGDDRKLLAVLAESIELVGERCLELLAGDVAQLRLGN